MARGRGRGSDDDARNWTPGDMLRNQEEMDAANVAREEVHRTYEADEAKAKQLLDLAAKACKNAKRGGLASMKKSGNGYVIIITEPKKK